METKSREPKNWARLLPHQNNKKDASICNMSSYLIVMIAIDLQIKNWIYIIEHTNHTHHTTELLSYRPCLLQRVFSIPNSETTQNIP